VSGHFRVGWSSHGWLVAFFRIQLPWFVIRGVYFAGCGLLVFAFSLLNDDVSKLTSDFIIALVMPVLVMDWRWITSSLSCECRVFVRGRGRHVGHIVVGDWSCVPHRCSRRNCGNDGDGNSVADAVLRESIT
jgi:hypothetical protein